MVVGAGARVVLTPVTGTLTPVGDDAATAPPGHEELANAGDIESTPAPPSPISDAPDAIKPITTARRVEVNI